MSIAIIPGFGEGHWHTKRLHTALMQHGYTRARWLHQADVIITHSAGCFFLPKTMQAQQIICINPPYWPDQSTAKSLIQKLWQDLAANARRRTIRFYLLKIIWNCVYISINLIRIAKIAYSARQHNFYKALSDKPVAIIRSDNDTWLTPDAQQRLPPSEMVSFYRARGEHDDCWLYTEEYAELMSEIIKK